MLDKVFDFLAQANTEIKHKENHSVGDVFVSDPLEVPPSKKEKEKEKEKENPGIAQGLTQTSTAFNYRA